jgi:hypothetical protein
MIRTYDRRPTFVCPKADSSDAFSPVEEQADLSSIDQWVAAFTNGASAYAASSSGTGPRFFSPAAPGSEGGSDNAKHSLTSPYVRRTVGRP